MNKAFKPWQKQLDDFDAAVNGFLALETTARLWGAVAPAVPALFDALVRYTVTYRSTAGELRAWIEAHEDDTGSVEDFATRLFATIESARRVKGLIDAYDREKAIAETLYPELAGGSLKDTAVPKPVPPAPPSAPSIPERGGYQRPVDRH
jgi:hypothetical protein